MKYKTFFLFVVIGLLSLNIARNTFNSHNIGIVWDYNSHEDDNFISVYLDDLNEQEKVIVKQTFIDMLDDYNLNAYRLLLENIMGGKTTVIYHSSNTSYQEEILISNGETADLSKGLSYSTIDKDINLRIYTILSNEVISLVPLQESVSDFGLTGNYLITPNDDIKDLDFLLNEIVLKLNSLFDSEIANYQIYHSNNSEDHIITYDENKNDRLLGYLVVIFFAFLINSSLINKTKEISKVKLEGHSNLSILFNYYLKYVVINIMVLSVIYALIIFLFMPSNLKLLSPFITALLNHTFIFTGISTFVGIFYYFIIVKIPINLSVKGKSFSKFTKDILIYSKLLFIILVFPYFLSSFDLIVELTNDIMHIDANAQRYKNLYTVGTTKFEYTNEASIMGNSLEMYEVKKQLVSEKNAFHYSTSEYEYYENNKLKIGFYSDVDQAFILNNNLVKEVPATITVFLYKDKELSTYLKTLLNEYYGEFEIVYYENSVINYSNTYVNNIINANDQVLVYTGENDHPINNTIYSMLFFHEGDLDSARNYIEQALLDNGMNSYYKPNSVYEDYIVLLERKIAASIDEIIFVIIFISILITLNIQIINLDQASNGKKYFLEYIEGNYLGSFVYNYVLPNVLVYLFIQFVFFILFRERYFELLLGLVVIVSVEMFLSFLYNRSLTLDAKGGINQ